MRHKARIIRETENLLVGLTTQQIAALRLAEQVLCTIFKEQWSYGSDNYYFMRLALLNCYYAMTKESEEYKCH